MSKPSPAGDGEKAVSGATKEAGLDISGTLTLAPCLAGPRAAPGNRVVNKAFLSYSLGDETDANQWPCHQMYSSSRG